jgi:hypothetical protein
LLQNGKVLVTGGVDNRGSVRGRAEVYDPSTGIFKATGNMILAREEHTATLLPNGTVLIAGGTYYPGPLSKPYTYITNTTEVYDPSTGVFISSGAMTAARVDHTATLLADGEILIARGFGPTTGNPYNTAELYNLASSSFTATGSNEHHPGKRRYRTIVVGRASADHRREHRSRL